MIPSSKQSKLWRKQQSWYINGKSNECEKYQIQYLESIFPSKNIVKCNDRINMETNTLDYSIMNPMNRENGLEYTENFDRKCCLDKYTYYFNLKFICDRGGAQDRTIRLVYDFIKRQFVVAHKRPDIYFINILDGDCSFAHMKHFNYLKKMNSHLTNKVYIGDSYGFKTWYIYTLVMQELNQKLDVEVACL